MAMLAPSSISSPLCSQAVGARARMWPSGSGMCPGKTSHQEGVGSRVEAEPSELVRRLREQEPLGLSWGLWDGLCSF